MLLYAIGAIGFLMRRFDFPTAPVIIGMILGPLAEQNRRGHDDLAGDWTVFFTRPLSATLLALAVLAMIGPKLYDIVTRTRHGNVSGGDA